MNEANKASGMGPIKKSSLLQLVENVLDNSQSPSIPQAGFIEQLRASNPYTPARIGYKQRGAIWNECVDKAAEILNSPKTPNNEPII
jgi:hypothetical protein